MKYQHIGGLAYQSFQSIQGWLLGAISILLTIFFTPAETITLRTFLLFVVGGALIIATLIQLSWRLYNVEPALLPSLITVESAPAPGNPNATVLLLYPSELFAHESYVAIYRYTHSFERLIGVGYVFTIQQDLKIQILVSSFVEHYNSETWQSLLSKNADTMKQIIVKPHLPKTYLEQL